MSGAQRIDDRHSEDLVLARLDRVLDAADEEALDAHLSDCQECVAFAGRQERLHASVRALAATHVDAAERARLWAAIASRRQTPPTSWPRRLGQLAFAATVLLVAALVSFLLVQSGPAAAPPPVREVVETRVFDVRVGTATLSVLQGSALAREGMRIGVAVSAELRLDAPATAGRAEIRFAQPGDVSYGILGAAPDLTGSTRVTLGGAVPRLSDPEPVIYEIWLHMETSTGASDTQPLVVQVTATRDGEEARPH